MKRTDRNRVGAGIFARDTRQASTQHAALRIAGLITAGGIGKDRIGCSISLGLAARRLDVQDNPGGGNGKRHAGRIADRVIAVGEQRPLRDGIIAHIFPRVAR